MTIEDLIKHLESFPKDLEVIASLHSEYVLLDHRSVQIIEACEPRNDGWVQCARKDMPCKNYLAIEPT